MHPQSKPLPSEVWTHVFGLLPPADKLRVRATCKYFRNLIDHPALWRDWTVVLRLSKGAYREHFWRTLRRWRVSSAAVRSSLRSSSSSSWTHLARDLPGLSALVIDECHGAAVESLQRFTNLRRLCVRRGDARVSFWDFLVLAVSPQLAHLSLCDVTFLNTSPNNFTPADAQFSGLRSLVFHSPGFSGDPGRVLLSILASLPQLLHLSLSARACSYQLQNLAPPQNSSLSSLELVECSSCSLSQDFMQLLPPLRSLALFYKPGVYGEPAPPELHLRHWLRDLPRLSALAVVNGPAVSEFLGWIPSSVTDLTLRPPGLSSEELLALSAQLPDLRRLHLEPRRFLGKHTALIPRLFPKLQTLRVLQEQVPQEDFLSLLTLEELEELEIRDSVLPRPALLRKLRELTKNRVRISTRQRDPLWSCDCVSFCPLNPGHSQLLHHGS